MNNIKNGVAATVNKYAGIVASIIGSLTLIAGLVWTMNYYSLSQTLNTYVQDEELYQLKSTTDYKINTLKDDVKDIKDDVKDIRRFLMGNK